MSTRKERFGTAAVSIAVATLLTAGAAAAQDVSYTSTTGIEFGSGGFLGGLLTRAAAASGPVTETVHIKGNRMRTDTDPSSTILDLDAGRVIMLNHQNRTYSVLTFEQMRAMAEAAAQAMREGMEAEEAEGDGTDVDFDFDLAVERTGERQRIHGANAERVFTTLKAKATSRPEDGDEEVSGTMVFFTESWQSTDFPGYGARQRFDEAMGEAMGGGARDFAGAIQQAYAEDPRMHAGLERAAKEAEKLEGLALRSTVYMVAVPDGMEFDRAAVLGGGESQEQVEEERPRRGLRGLARAAQRAAQQAHDDDDGEPRQVRLLSVTTEISEVETGNLPASLFEIPADYRQVQPEGFES